MNVGIAWMHKKQDICKLRAKKYDPRHLGAAKRTRTIRAQQKGRRAKRVQNKKGAEQKGCRTKRVRDHDVASPLHSRS